MAIRENAHSHEYELGHSDWELERLRRQARLIDPFTRQFFQDAGVSAAMKLLDVGSGAGDTALLAADIVGDLGEVVGFDKSPVAVAAAQNRIKGLGRRNISFRQEALDGAEFVGKFDAIVGRYVLMFNPDPAGMLKPLVRLLRPGGVIVFHEVDWNGCRSYPIAPLYDRCRDWIVQTFEKVGTNPYMGQTLHAAFVGAGLPPPSMAIRALVGGPRDSANGCDLIAELAITMAPAMEEQGVSSAAKSTLKTSASVCAWTLKDVKASSLGGARWAPGRACPDDRRNIGSTTFYVRSSRRAREAVRYRPLNRDARCLTYATRRVGAASSSRRPASLAGVKASFGGRLAGGRRASLAMSRASAFAASAAKRQSSATIG
jgi:SAM-dependent methyltransferase